MKLEVVLLGEGLTEQIVMPIFLQRCIHIFQKNTDVSIVDFIENPATKDSTLLDLLRKTYLKYSIKLQADILLVGRDNDNKQKHLPHDDQHTKKAEPCCFFCKLKQEIEELQKSNWLPRKIPTIIFIPVEAIESWLLYPKELFPENLTRFEAKNKLCGTLRLSRKIIEKYHKPLAEEIDIQALRKNVKSFDLFFVQLKNFMKQRID
ncbi:MAG: hypothetical protein HUU50_11490 [Candidatus Brocadiae bacterium]|nr:hypothetical protein [Candidatus Brocadiia bacterium]